MKAPGVVWASGGLLVLFYTVALFAPLVAPYPFAEQNRGFPNCPPSTLRVNPVSFWAGESVLSTRAYRLENAATRQYAIDEETRVPVYLLRQGHLFTTAGEQRFFLFGTDGLGRDLFSRLVYGSRISLSIGVVGVVISFTIGAVIGGFAGYVGGRIDGVFMRIVEVLMSLPSFYFLLALAAIVPPNLSPAQTFFLIVALMSFIRWADFARVIRGMAASLREREYIVAARALGGTRWRIVWRHIIPNTFSYTIVAATLGIPGFILGESALSLLGLGIQEPSASWGNMLAEAQNVQNLRRYPWILSPGVFIFLTVMSFNFLGDWLRDRYDPRRG